MSRELVSLAIINKALNLPEHTPPSSTLTQLHQLVAFRKRHQLCNNIIFTLRDQLAKLNLQIATQTQEYLTRKLELARVQTQRLFRVDNEVERLVQIKAKTYPKYQSYQQFVNDEFTLKSTKTKAKRSNLNFAHSLSHCYIPLSEVIHQNELKWQSKERASKLEQKQPMNDSV